LRITVRAKLTHLFQTRWLHFTNSRGYRKKSGE
jgi:hypothetical protein